MGRVAIAVVVACALCCGVARAQTPDQACAQASPSSALCTGADKLAEAAAAECRRIGLPETDCALPLGHQVSSEIVRAYEKTWLHRAAAFQYRLGHSLPFLRAQWLGTHNSFNSVNGEPTASHTDSNQQLSLTQQLNIDIRSLELDLHWVPSADAGGSQAVVVCHGRGPDEENFGCTTEPLFSAVLPEIRAWLEAHPSEVVLLYLEDELGNADGYKQAVATLDSVLGGKIYRPSPSEMTAKGCAQLPLGISRDDVRARGAQVVIVGNCRTGWASDVYSWDDNHVESGSTPDYKPFPTCDRTYSRSVYDSKLVRYYEDSTFVSAATDPTQSPAQAQAQMLTPDRVASMTHCGVNLFGFDQILPNDGRLDATIWSWASGEPNARGGRCGAQGADGRWITARCSTRRPAVCRSATGALTLTPRAVKWDRAGAACKAEGSGFDLPRTGYENSTLRAAAGSQSLWLRYKLPGG